MRLRADQALIAEWIRPKSRILDLGCGDGRLLAALQQKHGASGYGVEIDPENIIKCIANGINVVQSNLDEGLADFDDNSFDYVVMTQTIQAVRYPQRLLHEMLRIGREGIVTFPNMGHWKCRFQLAFGKMPITRHLPNDWHSTPNIHICTIADFKDMCHAENIAVLQQTTVDSEHRAGLAMRILPNLLGEIAMYRLRRGLKPPP
ncbi:MAG TPA: methionine biosynthesis protein MetW [Gammaproteobacteria bacterium]|nr:methionine biosynthesis protein MetW [Gammaproteobacteria bacterium]|tara:strand:- start:119 stop:730 length:612 start_codon:yes stop_codon:yes gene_type:complete